MTLSKAYSKYGADMGRRSDVFPDDFEGTIEVLEMALEGDYDSGGAYWGATPGTTIFRLTAETEDGTLVRYERSRSFDWLVECERMRWGSRVRLVKEIGDDRIEQFVGHYMLTALWSSSNDEGDAFDEKGYDVAEETLAKFRTDCVAFLHEADVIAPGESDAKLAHDFWLTRNGHGAGFWDGDYEEEIGKKLTELSKKFGEVYLYVGDDEKVYQS